MKPLKFMIQITIAVVLLIFGLWLVYRAGLYLYSVVRPGREITIMPFEGATADKSASQAILSSKLRSLRNRSQDAPAGYGVLSLPLLDAEFLRTREPTNAVGVLDDIEFKIKDVNLGAVVKAFDAALSPRHYELRGSVSRLPGSTRVMCNLMLGESLEASWESEVRGGTGDEVLAKAIDEIVYKMIYDFITDVKLKKFKVKAGRQTCFTNWRGLQNYVNGLSAFRAFQVNLDTNDLQAAYAALDKMVLDVSDKQWGLCLGLYFRGLVLSEQRKEAEAVEDFERLQRVLEQSDTPTAAGTNSEPLLDAASKRQMLYGAKLNEATTRLKFYSLESGEKAEAKLEELIDAIQKDIDPTAKVAAAEAEVARANEGVKRARKALAIAEEGLKSAPTGQQQDLADDNKKQADNALVAALQAQTRAKGELHEVRKSVAAAQPPYLTKLLVHCQAQLGYTHGTILSFLADKEVAAGDPRVKQHIDDKDECLQQAENWYGFFDATHGWTERERKDARFRISNARGYGRFREAHFRKLQAPEREKAETYKSLCREAIRDLETARENRPDHYEVLQNLGMIYDDEGYDPQGEFLPKATQLFEETKRYVPEDYYQYEQLAFIHWRWANIYKDPGQVKAEIDAGRKDATTALQKRAPEVSARALRHLSRFAWLEWQLSNRQDNKEAAETLRAFRNAMPFCAKKTDFSNEYADLLSQLAALRANSATGLVELADHALDLARYTPQADFQKLEAFRQDLAGKWKKLDEAANQAENKANQERLAKEAEELKKHLDQLQAALGLHASHSKPKARA